MARHARAGRRRLRRSGFGFLTVEGERWEASLALELEAGPPMCRNIRTLSNFEPPATDEEIRASALQFVRKISGFAHPSKANQPAFDLAVEEVADVASRLLNSLKCSGPMRDRAVEAEKAKERSRRRFALLGSAGG